MDYRYLLKKNIDTSSQGSKTTSNPSKIGGLGDQSFLQGGNKPLVPTVLVGKAKEEAKAKIIARKEQTLKENSKPSKPKADGGVGVSFMKGLNSFNESLFKIPRYLYNAASIPQNAIAELSGNPEWAANYEAVMSKESTLAGLDRIGDFYKHNSDKYAERVERFDKGVFESIKSGNYSAAAKQVANNIAETIPSIAGMYMTGGVGNAAKVGKVGKTLINALPFASAKNAELQERTDIPEYKKTIDATLNGLAEVVFDQEFGTKAILDDVIRSFGEEGREVAVKKAKDFVGSYLQNAVKKVQPLTSGVKNAIEESATKYSQNLVDKLTIDPDKDAFEGIPDAAITGGVTGTAIQSVGTINGVLNSKRKAKLNEAVNRRAEIVNDLDNDNLPEEIKEDLVGQLEKENEKIAKISDEAEVNLSNLPEKEQQEAIEIQNQIEVLESSLNAKDVSEGTKKTLEEKIDKLQEDLDVLSETSSILSKPDSEEQITKEAKEAEEKLAEGGDQTEYEQRIQALDERAKALKETVGETSQEVAENESPVSQQQEATTEVQGIGDGSLQNEEVVKKADLDLESLKKVSNKVAKYEASIKRLVEAKNNKTITANEFNEIKQRFDDVLTDSDVSIPKVEQKPANEEIVGDEPTVEPTPEGEQEGKMNDSWGKEFERAKNENDLDAIETLYNKVKVSLNGLSQGKGEATVKQFQQLKAEIEQYADDWKQNKQPQASATEQPQSEEVESETTEEEKDLGVIGITKKEAKRLKEELGLEEYKYEVQKKKDVIKEADEEMGKGYNVKDLVRKVGEGHIANPVENELIRRYLSSLTASIGKDPKAELIAERVDLLKILDIAKTRAGRAVQSFDGLVEVEDNLANFLNEEMSVMGVTELPQDVIDDLKSKWDAGAEAKKKYDEGYAKAVEDLSKEKAEGEITKLRKSIPRKERKTKEDFTKEREEIAKSIREKLKKARQQTNAAVVPYLNELVAISPDVAKLVRSYVEEGIIKIEDIVDKIHNDFKEDIDGLTKKDVRDLIAGEYNEKKKSKNEITAQVRDLRTQAQLLKKIEDLENGKKPKTEVEKVKRSQEVAKLQEQIKEIQKRNREVEKEFQEPREVTHEQKLKARQTWLKNKIEQLKKDLETENFALEPEVPKRLKLDAETQKYLDEYIAFKNETKKRRDRARYEQMSKWEKAWDMALQVTGLRRLVQTSIDLSMPFRQTVRVTVNPRHIAITTKGFSDMLKAVFNAKRYSRIMHAIETSPDYRDMVEDGIKFAEIESYDNNNREEDYRTSFIYKIPYLREPFMSSNRAAAAYQNSIRYELYMKMKRNLEKQGFTKENSPESYKGIANWTMNMTGRGKLPDFIEKSQAGQRVLGNTFYGIRLMAAHMNTLNPAYYYKMPKPVRMEAMKDMAAYSSVFVASLLAAAALGAEVSLDPDDSDFGKIKVGNKRYDLSGGQVQYIRTFLRLVKAGYYRLDPDTRKKKADKYAIFAGNSTQKFFRYKLAPNTSYALSGFFGKDPLGKEFNPYEVLKVYPMYIDDMTEAWKEDGATSLATIFIPSILGIGVQNYESKKKETREGR